MGIDRNRPRVLRQDPQAEPYPDPAVEDIDAKSGKQPSKKEPWWVLPLLAVILAAFLNLFILLNAHIPSGSMEPTIATGSLVLGDRTAYLRGEPQAGDVVFFRHESEFGRRIIVKRVIALPGQTFSMVDGRVYLDGRLLDEPYITQFSWDSYPETVVPEGCCIVLGDHRTNSNDSRFWTDPFVRWEDLLGRAMFVYFPRFHTL